MVTTLRHNPARTLAGVGLVELMITLLLGALITAGTIALFTANRQSFRLQDNLARTQEAGSFALEFLARDIRRAGYPGEGMNKFAAFNINAAAPAGATATTVNDRVQTRARTINGAAVNVNFVDDQLAIVFRPDALSPNTDCTGAALPAGFNFATDYVVNVYSVQDTADLLDRELVCQGFHLVTDAANAVVSTAAISNPPQALVSGVESFQVLYGIDTSFTNDVSCPLNNNPSEPTLYINGSQLGNAIAFGRKTTDPAPAGQALACEKRVSPISTVRAVRVALLVRTSTDVDATVPAARVFTLLDQTLTGGATTAAATNFPPINDGRVRRVFLTTVALHNIERVLVAPP